MPFITEAFVRAIHTPEESRSDEDREALKLSDTLVAELQRADRIVIGSGMINFGIPAPLKAWIDHVTRAGLTFSYGSGGPEGLLKGKKTYLALASGGAYSDGPATAMDFQRPYLIGMLGFIGLIDVEVILAEGTLLGPGAGERALAAALEQVARIGARAGGARPESWRRCRRESAGPPAWLADSATGPYVGAPFSGPAGLSAGSTMGRGRPVRPGTP